MIEALQALLPFVAILVFFIGFYFYRSFTRKQRVERLKSFAQRIDNFLDQNQSEMNTLIGAVRQARNHDDPIDAFLGMLSSDATKPTNDPALPFPAESRFSGMWIVAPQGRGKTNLLQFLFMNDIRQDCSVVVMDSKGDFIDSIRNLKEIKDRLVIIDPDLDHPIALNPLDVGVQRNDPLAIYRAVQFLEGLFSTAQLDLSQAQSSIAHPLLYALISAVPNATIRDFKVMLTDGYKNYRSYIETIPDDDIRNYFLSGQFDKASKDTKAALLWRIDKILQHPVLKVLFSAPRTKLNIGQLLDEGSIIIVNNSKALLGDDGSEFFARFFLTLIRTAADQRSGRKQEDKMPVFFYIDEAQNVIADEPQLAKIIQECRSQKIGMICAHQEVQQITNKAVLGALSNCAIRLANSDEEAAILAPMLRAPHLINTLRDGTQKEGQIDIGFLRQPKGTFAAFIRDQTPHAMHISIPLMDMSQYPKMSLIERAQLRKNMAQYEHDAPPNEPPPPKTSPWRA